MNENEIKQDKKIDPSRVWEEYRDSEKYLTEHNLYNTVKRNEEFVEGNQWNGADTGSILTITMNELKRIRDYQCAAIASSDVGININSSSDSRDSKVTKFITSELKKAIEQSGMKEDSRLVVNDSFASGFEYMLQGYDPDFDNGTVYKGRLINQIVDCTQIGFGNPYDKDIQSQPYIIIALRQHVEQVKDEARMFGLSDFEIEDIKPDTDDNDLEDDNTKLCTVLLRYWKKPLRRDDGTWIKTVHFCKTTKNVVLKDDTDLGYRRYPISRFGWIPKKRSYIFESPVTSNISTQIFLNKMFTIGGEFGVKSGFPKPIIDKNKIDPKKLLDGTGNALVTANADLLGKFIDYYKAPDFSGQIVNFINLVKAEMREVMGVNDTVLGNIRPENAQAILSITETTTTPLKIQQQLYYDFWEDSIRNYLDIMTVSYGKRKVVVGEEEATVDFSMLKGINFDLDIDVSSSAQFSEIGQFQSVSNMLDKNMLTLEEYLEVVNNKVVPVAALKEILAKRQANPQPVPIGNNNVQ